MTAAVPATNVRTGQRVHVAGKYLAVASTATRLVETRFGGSRHMVCFELHDGTRYDVPLDMRVPVVSAGGAR